METKDIPFTGQASGLDELSGAASKFQNVRRDVAGVVRSRPGVRAWPRFPADVPSTAPVTMVGVFDGKVIYVTEGGELFAWQGDGVPVMALSLGGGDTLLDGTMRPEMVTSGSVCVIVADGAPQKVSAGLLSQRLGGSPPSCFSAAIIARRLVLASADGIFYWSGILDIGVETWDTEVEFRAADAKQDPLVSLRASSRELWAWGTETLQVYSPEADSIGFNFSPTSTLDVGNLAARSVINWRNLNAWLDDQHQFVISDGRAFDNANILSSPMMTATIKGLGVVNDCWGFREQLGAHDCLVWVFPTEGRVFLYDMSSKAWGESTGYLAGRRSGWMPTAAFNWIEQKTHLVGSSDGRLNELTFDAHGDMGDPILSVARSGFIDRGVMEPKLSHRAFFQFRRGEAQSEDSAVSVRFRDDLGGFGPATVMPLGTAGDSQPVVEIAPVGEPYRQREWEVSWSAEDAVSMTAAKETYEVQELG
jgi:hypothetical protein